jgi:hypothetical protein
MGMNVKIGHSCDRCKRQEEIEIDSDKIADLQAKEKMKQQTRLDIEKFFSGLGEGAPDLVVLFKGKVQTTSNICDAHCVKPVQNQLENAFRVSQPRKPRAKKDKTTAATKTPEKAAETKGKGKGESAAST